MKISSIKMLSGILIIEAEYVYLTGTPPVIYTKL